jgi:hypothetical protein
METVDNSLEKDHWGIDEMFITIYGGEALSGDILSNSRLLFQERENYWYFSVLDFSLLQDSSAGLNSLGSV